jgi:hypothetical protein
VDIINLAQPNIFVTRFSWTSSQQGRGQYISVLCSTSTTDYACTPCSQSCPSGSYISGRCDGRGRTDTSCSACRQVFGKNFHIVIFAPLFSFFVFCVENFHTQIGVPCRWWAEEERWRGHGRVHGWHVQRKDLSGCAGNDWETWYIVTRLFLSHAMSMQVCLPCKRCPSGTWPSPPFCSGLTFSDPVVCTPCATMASCPNSTHYYLQGQCDLGEEVCVIHNNNLCSPTL